MLYEVITNWNKGAENERIEISEEIRWEVDERKVEEIRDDDSSPSRIALSYNFV